ncbi:unnamed protein product [Peronospora farinosa]|uniref:RxLR effector protein n=1 Tax=Peronospora farinosa TaxID=134698 RepID=A0ABN8C0H9_9STRA|nr:unnamed protein product [Peronospora farinosa]
MRVRLVLSLLAVAAIGCAVKAKTTTPVVRSHIDSSDVSEDNNDGDRMISLDSLITKAKDILTTNPFKGLTRATKQPNLVDDQLVKAVEQPKPVDDQLEITDEIVDGQLEKDNEIIDDQLEKVYERLQLRGSDDELFERLNGLLWLEEADELAAKYHRSTYALVIDSLTKRLGDKRVAELIQTARKVSKTKAIAIKLKNAQMRYWLKSGTSATEVFGRLGMESAMYSLLTHPLFNYWCTYAERYKLLDPNSSALKSLTTFFGEKGVSELLQFAPQDTSSEELAKILQTEQITAWAKNGQSLEDVFNLLGLNRAGSKILEDPLLNVFTGFTSAFNAEHKFDLKSSGATKKHGVLEAVNYAPGTSLHPTEREKALFQLWFVKNEKPEDVFRNYLAKAGDNLLTSPLFTTFLKYTDTYSLNKRKDVSVYKIIRDDYKAGGAVLVNQILSLKEVPNTPAKYAAERVEADIYRRLKDPQNPTSPDELFEFLRLHEVKEPAKLFQDRMFEYWMECLDVFLKQPNAKHISRSYLATGYDENALLLTIIEAEMNDKTKEIATKLKTELFKQYAFAEKAPADVLDLLKRNNLRTSQWSFFKSYVNDYRRVTQEIGSSTAPRSHAAIYMN